MDVRLLRPICFEVIQESKEECCVKASSEVHPKAPGGVPILQLCGRSWIPTLGSGRRTGT